MGLCKCVSDHLGAHWLCPSECSDPEPPGFTFGALAANANGECDGFLSPAGYCGGHCYNQPDIGNNSSTQGPIAVQAPTDCRSCKIARSHGICEPGYVPYAEDGVAGSGCCRQLGVAFVYPPGFALPFLAFPQSSVPDANRLAVFLSTPTAASCYCSLTPSPAVLASYEEVNSTRDAARRRTL